MAKGDWVHRDEFDSMKALYEIRITNLEDENQDLKNTIDLLQDDGDDDYQDIIDAEIVED
jgi:hypothetical protein